MDDTGAYIMRINKNFQTGRCAGTIVGHRHMVPFVDFENFVGLDAEGIARPEVDQFCAQPTA